MKLSASGKVVQGVRALDCAFTEKRTRKGLAARATVQLTTGSWHLQSEVATRSAGHSSSVRCQVLSGL